jgi:arylsulfatase A-like enzyme
VPYLVKWPAKLPAGASYAAPVMGFDIFATAAAAAGVSVPADRKIDGVDLAPFARGEREGVPHERLFWRSGHSQVARVGDWKLQVNERPPGTAWLFNLREDPTEQTNLASREPERVAELRRALAEHNAEQAEPSWPALIEMPVSVDKTLAVAEAEGDEYIYWPN